MEYSEEIKTAYNKMINASSKYDVEFKTPYGRKVMRETYNKLSKLCEAQKLNTLTVCGELAMLDWKGGITDGN